MREENAMSAINVIKQSAGVHVLTDGAAYRGDEIVRTASKVWPAAHIPTIFAVRGPGWFAGSIVDRLVFGIETWKQLKAQLSDRLRVISSKMNSGHSDAGPALSAIGVSKDDLDKFEVVAVRICDEGEFDGFLTGNHSSYGNVPFELRPLGDCAFLPGDAGVEREFIAGLPEGATTDDVDPFGDGIRLLEIHTADVDGSERRDLYVDSGTLGGICGPSFGSKIRW
jgi:hypothetical protein